MAFRQCALAVALGSLVPVATLVCVTWFAGACAYTCGLFVCRRRFEVQAAVARVCVGILARVLHTLLVKAILAELVAAQGPLVASALAYAAMWCAARNSGLVHGPGCRLWTSAAYGLAWHACAGDMSGAL